MQKSFSVGTKTFVLDQDKAEAAFAAKKVINGRQVPYFNILPLMTFLAANAASALSW